MSKAIQPNVDLIRQRVSDVKAISDQPVVVSIDGRSGTGKSTLGASLAEVLDAALIEGDDFYAGGTELHDLADEALAALCINWRRQRDVLRALKSGASAHYHRFDWNAFDGSLSSQPVIVTPSPVIVLEGVYAARPELRDLIDISVLLRLPESERIARILTREGSISAWERQWWRAEAWYFANRAPPDTFDMVLTISSAE